MFHGHERIRLTWSAKDNSVPGIKQTATYLFSGAENPRVFFREINQGIPRAHHDALEFPDGQIVLLTLLHEGQQATVLQLPAAHERAQAAQPDKAKV